MTVAAARLEPAERLDPQDVAECRRELATLDEWRANLRRARTAFDDDVPEGATMLRDLADELEDGIDELDVHEPDLAAKLRAAVAAARVTADDPNHREQPAAARRDEWARIARDGAELGNRGRACARFAGYLLATALDPRVALELLIAWDGTRNRPPLGRSEVERIADAIAGRELAKRRGKTP